MQIAAEAQQQAALLSYLDCFRVLSIMFLVVIPLMFLMRRTTPGKSAIGGH